MEFLQMFYALGVCIIIFIIFDEQIISRKVTSMCYIKLEKFQKDQKQELISTKIMSKK